MAARGMTLFQDAMIFDGNPCQVTPEQWQSRWEAMSDGNGLGSPGRVGKQPRRVQTESPQYSQPACSKPASFRQIIPGSVCNRFIIGALSNLCLIMSILLRSRLNLSLSTLGEEKAKMIDAF